jgi:hypothetical protein
VHRNRFIIALAAGLACLAALAPSALAGGKLTVEKNPVGGGTVAATIPERNVITGAAGNPTTILTCGTDCSATVDDYQVCSGPFTCTAHAETVLLTQTAMPGWHFTGWTADCAPVLLSPKGSCSVRMDNDGDDLPVDRTVKANYADVAAPSATLSGPVEGAKLHGTIPLGATAGDNAGVTKVEWFVNNSSIGADTTPGDGFSKTFNTASYPHAQTLTVKVVASDAAGNQSLVGADDQRTYQVDSKTGVHFEAPTPAQDAWVTGPAAVAFAIDGDTPSDAGATLQCQVDDGGYHACSSPLAGSAFAADGTYKVDVKATDDAFPTPNVATVQRTFRVDRTAPVVSMSQPAEGSVQFPAFTPAYSVTEANPADAAPVTCSLDGGAFGTCGALSGLAGGAHTYSVKAVDKAGHETVVTHAFNVDGTPPEAEITNGPAENEIVRTDSVAFGFKATDPSAPLVRECRVDGAFGPCSTASSHSASGLSEGAHVFELRVADAAGNTVTVHRDFVVNAIRPTVAITGGPAEGAVIHDRRASFHFTATGGGVQCSLDSETIYRACSTGGSDTVSGLRDGGHTFRVRVRDASNDEVVKSRTFHVDTSPPAVAPAPRPAAPAPAAPPIQEIRQEIIRQTLNPLLSSSYRAAAKFTVFRRLVLKGVPRGADVSVTCKGRRCPAKSAKKLTRFTKRRLAVGTTLTIRVTKPGTIGKQFLLAVRARRAPRLSITQIA